MGSFWAPNFLGGQYPTNLFVLPTDTRHVLKFRKDPFRGVNGINSKKATFAKQMLSPYRRRSVTLACDVYFGCDKS